MPGDASRGGISASLRRDVDLLASLNRRHFSIHESPSSSLQPPLLLLESFDKAPGAVRVSWLEGLGLVTGESSLNIDSAICTASKRWDKCFKYLKKQCIADSAFLQRQREESSRDVRTTLDTLLAFTDVVSLIMGFFGYSSILIFRSTCWKFNRDFCHFNFLRTTRRMHLAKQDTIRAREEIVAKKFDSYSRVLSIQDPALSAFNQDLNGATGHYLRISDVFEKLGLDKLDITEVKEYVTPPLIVVMILGVGMMLMDRNLSDVNATARRRLQNVLELAIASGVDDEDKELHQEKYDEAWKIITTSEGALAQPNRWSVKQCALTMLSASRRQDLVWSKDFLRKYELSVGGELSCTRKLRFIGKFPLVLYKISKAIIQICDDFDDENPEDASVMKWGAANAEGVKKEIAVVDKLIAVDKNFENEEEVTDEHKALNAAWVLRWKKIRHRWNKDKLREESKRRLYS